METESSNPEKSVPSSGLQDINAPLESFCKYLRARVRACEPFSESVNLLRRMSDPAVPGLKTAGVSAAWKNGVDKDNPF